MSKKSKVLLILYTSALIFGLALGLVFKNNELSFYKRQLDYNYSHAMNELVSEFDELVTSLGKSRYSTDRNMLTGLCTDIYAKAMTAQMALGVLPNDGAELSDTASFISKVGDYSYAASCGLATESVGDTLSGLSDTAADISARLHDMYDSGNATMYSDYSGLSNIENKSSHTSDGFDDTEKEFPETPSLIYDGPFSDDVDSGSYSMVSSLPKMTEDQILASLTEKTGITDLKLSGKVEGDIVCFVFENSDTRITASENGGLICSIKSNADSSDSKIDRNEAEKKASEFLSESGFVSMIPTYYIIQDNAVIINYAYKDGEYTCYPDLIKVRVSLSDGSILDMDASGYLRNHKERNIPTEKKSVSSCRSAVPESLKILSEGRAVIPTYGKKEKACFEYKCENSDGQHYIIYADTQSGEQRDILVLIEDENGILTM